VLSSPIKGTLVPGRARDTAVVLYISVELRGLLIQGIYILAFYIYISVYIKDWGLNTLAKYKYLIKPSWVAGR
jgi:hypothetical protein